MQALSIVSRIALTAATIALPVCVALAEPVGERVKTDPDPYEQFLISQAIKVGDLVFVSGQVGMDLDGNIVGVGDFQAQAEQTFEMLATVLEAAGSSLDRVIKVNIYVTDMSNFPTILELRERYFSKPYPADTIVEISALGLPELEVEIDAIALVGGQLLDAE